MCPSVRPSQAGIVSKLLDESSWFLVWRLPSVHPTLCCKEIFISPKVLPSGTLCQTPDSATASGSRCQQNSSSSMMVEFVNDTYTTICLLQVGQLQPSNSITLTCCAFVVQLVLTVDNILTDTAHRAVHLQ